MQHTTWFTSVLSFSNGLKLICLLSESISYNFLVCFLLPSTNIICLDSLRLLQENIYFNEILVFLYILRYSDRRKKCNCSESILWQWPMDGCYQHISLLFLPLSIFTFEVFSYVSFFLASRTCYLWCFRFFQPQFSVCYFVFQFLLQKKIKFLFYLYILFYTEYKDICHPWQFQFFRNSPWV